MKKKVKPGEERFYVDKEEFLALLVDYKSKRDVDPDARIPDSIGVAIQKIAQNLGRAKNFSGYMFLEEMISAAIENALKAVKNFDPSNSAQNPFGYFTRVIYFSFLRTIEDEHKIYYEKQKMFINQGTFHQAAGHLPVETSEVMDDFVRKYEIKKEKKKQKARDRKIMQAEANNNVGD